MIVSENRIDRAPEFISPECCVRIGDNLIFIGVEGMLEHINATKHTYPDYTMKITKQFCDEDYVISEFIMEGTHEGEWVGIKPSHKKLTFTDVDINKVVNGKIVEYSGSVNIFETLFEQNLIKPV